MELLNENSLAELLTKCYENERYSAAVMFSTRTEVLNFMEDIRTLNAMEGITGVNTIRMGRAGENTIDFENGSRIAAIATTELNCARGYRYHAALLDEAVMDAEAMLQLQNMLRRYQAPSGRTATIDASQWEKEFVARAFGNSVSKSSDKELVIDEKSEQMLDGFLGSFKIKKITNKED